MKNASSIDDLRDHLVDHLQRRLKRPASKVQLAWEIVIAVAYWMGSLQAYIPTGIQRERERVGRERREEVFARFNGSNTRELAKEFGCSIRWIQMMYKEELEARRKGRKASKP